MSTKVRMGQITTATEDMIARAMEAAHGDGYADGFRAGIQYAAGLLQQESGFLTGGSREALLNASVRVLTAGDGILTDISQQRRAVDAVA